MSLWGWKWLRRAVRPAGSRRRRRAGGPPAELAVATVDGPKAWPTTKLPEAAPTGSTQDATAAPAQVRMGRTATAELRRTTTGPAPEIERPPPTASPKPAEPPQPAAPPEVADHQHRPSAAPAVVAAADDAGSDSEPEAAAGARRVDPAAAPPLASLARAFELLCQALDRPFGEAEIRAAAPSSADHMTLGNLLLAVERLGFEAKTVAPTTDHLAQLPPPFLLAGKHPGEGWLVKARAGDHLVVVDPLTGQDAAYDLATIGDLAERAVLLKMPLGAAGPRNWRGALWQRLRPVIWEVGLASVVINLLALATPIFLMTVYNKVINHGALQTLDVLVLGMVTLFTFEWLLRGLRSYIASHTGGRLDAALGSDVVHHLVHLPLRTFETVPTGQILERTRQLDSLRQFFTSQMPLLLVDLAFVGVFLTVLFYLDVRLGMITLAALPVFWLLALIAMRRQRPLVEEGFKATAAKASTLGETISQAFTVKALGLEPDMERRFRQKLADSAWTGFRTSHLSGLIASSGHALQHLVALLIVYVGARAIVAGDMSIGALIAATILTARVLGPMRQLSGAWQQLQNLRVAFARIDELMGQPNERRADPGPPLRLEGRIKLEHVVYRYADDCPPALDGVDLEIAPGQLVAVVGAPGSGKSTLAKLLCGLDTPEHGRVLVDDLDVRLWSPAILRRQIGVVPQAVQLFAGTIADNIAMGARERQFERVVAAAKFVGAHEFIQRLPKGYDTVLAERGSGLSAGQSQLISIARALIRNPRLLILDEATSALDAATEEILLTNLKRASRGRTVVMVTHRVGALGIADWVLHLADGRIDRQGPPGQVAAFTRARRPGFDPSGRETPGKPHLAPV